MTSRGVELINSFEGHQNAVYALVAGPDKQFISAGSDGIAALWSAETGANIRGVLQSPVPIYSLLYIAEKDLLIAGLNDGSLHFIRLAENTLLKSSRVHQKAIFDLQAFVHGNKIMAASEDGHVSVWDIDELEAKISLAISKASIRSIAFHPKGHEVAIGGSDRHIHLLDTENMGLIKEWQAHEHTVFTLRYSPDGNLLHSAGRDAHLKSWDAHNGYSPVVDVPAHLFAVNHLAYSADGRLMASSSMDKTIKIWEPITLKLLKVIDKPRDNGHSSSVNKVLWLPDNSLISCSDDRRVLQWKLNIPLP